MIATVGKWNGKQAIIAGHRATEKSVFEIGLIVEAQAKFLAPVDTGRLRASLTTQMRDRGSGAGQDVIERPTEEVTAHVGTAVHYAPYLEFGTRYMEAQPYLRPALDFAEGKKATVVESNIRHELREYMK
jgi:HK97 gp10 family phage protein